MYDRIASNVRKSWLLVFVFTAFVVLIGFVFGYVTHSGFWGIAIAAIFAIFSSWGSYFSSDKVALAMSHARPADENDYKQLHNIVEALSLAAGLPKPRVYIVDDPAPNAFATGRNPKHAAIAVTTGLLAKMDRDELEGVLAHELSHVKNRDTLVMMLAVTLVGVIVLLADLLLRALWWGGFGGDGDGDGFNPAGAIAAVAGIVLLLLAPLFAQLFQFAISRRREYLADIDGAFLTRYPDGLIHALQKLQSDPTVVKTASRATAHLWIESPIARQPGEGSSKRGQWLNRLFDTHPPLPDRIRALQEAEAGGRLPADATPRV